MLKLFYAPGTIALAVHIALEEAGASYELVRVNVRDGEQRKPDYLAINPKGRMPALVTEYGILTETPAILAYIAQVYPAATLAPTEPFAFAQVQAFNAYLCSTVHVAHAHRMRGRRWADDPVAIEDMKRKVPETVAACFSLIENEFFAGPWVMGKAYSISDIYLYTLSLWLEGDGVDPRRFPKILDHGARMSARPAVVRSLRLEA
eukprot:gene13283-13393_t